MTLPPEVEQFRTIVLTYLGMLKTQQRAVIMAARQLAEKDQTIADLERGLALARGQQTH
jgi:hypothetical protein